MIQYTVLIIFTTRGPSKEVLPFLKDIISLFIHTLEGVVLSCSRLAGTSYLSGNRRLRIYNRGLSRLLALTSGNTQVGSLTRDDIRGAETKEVSHFLLHVLLKTNKIGPLYGYMKDQPTVEGIHLFRS